MFPTQGSNPGLPHCRQILYQLSHKRRYAEYIMRNTGLDEAPPGLENPRDGGAWWASVYGVTQSRTRLK